MVEIWNLFMTVMEWVKTMIKPEIKLIKQYNWKHIDYVSQTVMNIPQICANERVSLIRISSSGDKMTETQLVCTNCGRALTIYGKQKN